MVLVALCEFIDLLASFTIREHDLRFGRRNETHIISTLVDLLLIHFSFLILSICNWTMYNVVKKDLFVASTYLLCCYGRFSIFRYERKVKIIPNKNKNYIISPH